MPHASGFAFVALHGLCGFYRAVQTQLAGVVGVDVVKRGLGCAELGTFKHRALAHVHLDGGVGDQLAAQRLGLGLGIVMAGFVDVDAQADEIYVHQNRGALAGESALVTSASIKYTKT